MGTKLPSTVASADSDGDAIGKEMILQEKYAWQKDRAIQFNPTASVLRYTVTGAVAYTRTKGTQTLVANLENLSCSVDEFTKSFEQKYGSVAEAGDKMFTFYDTEVVPSDRISYGGNYWWPVSVWWFEESGRCEVQARLVGET